MKAMDRGDEDTIRIVRIHYKDTHNQAPSACTDRHRDAAITGLHNHAA